MGPRERFARWVETSGRSKSEIAAALGCSDVYVGYLVSGKRERVGLDMAFAIERETAGWEEGPIAARDWAAEPVSSDGAAA